MNMQHMKYLTAVAHGDCRQIHHKEKTYRGSWKKRGGVGAAMMMLRKVDRLENMLADLTTQYDIFAAIRKDPSGADGSALAEIRDLRRYLLLIEAEMIAQGVVDGRKETVQETALSRAGEIARSLRNEVDDPQEDR